MRENKYKEMMAEQLETLELSKPNDNADISSNEADVCQEHNRNSVLKTKDPPSSQKKFDGMIRRKRKCVTPPAKN